MNSVDISHDGRYLVAGSDDMSVGLYDLEAGTKVNTYYNRAYGVDLVRFTHHNKCILCVSRRAQEHRIMYWSLHDNNILCSFLGHTEPITGIDLSPSNSTFLSSSGDGTTRIWDYTAKQSVIKFNRSRGGCFDNTGRVLACLFVKQGKSDDAQTASLDQMIHLFKTENFREKPFQTFTIENESQEIRQMKFSPNGKFLLLATGKDTLLLLNAHSGLIAQRLQASFNPSDLSTLPAIDFTPDSRFLISGSQNPQQNMFVWNLETYQQVPLMQFHLTNNGSHVRAVKFSHVHCLLATAC